MCPLRTGLVTRCDFLLSGRDMGPWQGDDGDQDSSAKATEAAEAR